MSIMGDLWRSAAYSFKEYIEYLTPSASWMMATEPKGITEEMPGGILEILNRWSGGLLLLAVSGAFIWGVRLDDAVHSNLTRLTSMQTEMTLLSLSLNSPQTYLPGAVPIVQYNADMKRLEGDMQHLREQIAEIKASWRNK